MPIDFAVETEIARRPHEVFAYVTDPSRLHEWQTTPILNRVLKREFARQYAALRSVLEGAE